jgi:predicted anti-sigma-YlaC factor YlaD
MSALCPILRGSFEDYLNDALPPPQRRILREHLSVCLECRDLAAANDASMIFARPYTDAPLPAADASRILDNVRTAVAFARTEQRIRHTSRRAVGAAAAAAAFGALLLLTPGGGTGAGTARLETAVAVTKGPASSEAPASIAPAAVQLSLEGEPVSLPSAEATVYDWNPGAGREEPRVVWIVDRGLDI